MKPFKVVPRINKSNQQINLNLPKKLLDKRLLERMKSGDKLKYLKINIEDWD